MECIKSINIDISKVNYVTVQTVQYDHNSRVLHINITNDGVPVDIKGHTAVISGEKPDGTNIFNDCKIISGDTSYIEATITEQMTAIEGAYPCNIELYGTDESLLSTKSFNLYVSKKSVSKNVTSTSEYTALKSALAEVQGIDNRFYETRKKEVLITEYDLSDSLKQQINGNAPIIQTISDRVITPQKTTFINSHNLINPDTCTKGKYIVHTSGELGTNSVYTCTDFIELEGGEEYCYSGVYSQHFAFYDESKTYVPTSYGVENNLTNPFVAPNNIKYIRVSIRINEGESLPSELGLVKGNNYGVHMPFAMKVDKRNLPLIESDMLGVISEDNIDDSTISTKKLTACIIAGNLMRDTTYSDAGRYVIHDTGELGYGLEYYRASDFIPIKPNNTFSYKGIHSSHFAFYDCNCTFIESGINTLGSVFTTPNDAYFMRLTVNVDEIALEEVILCAGNKLTDEATKYLIDSQEINLNGLRFTEENLVDGSVTPKKTTFLENGDNLFDPSKKTNGIYIDYATGEAINNMTYDATDYIKVLEGEYYTVSHNRMLAFYDAGKRFISGIEGDDTGVAEGNNVVVQAPINAMYIRVSVRVEYISTFMLNKGKKQLPYTPYGFKFTSDIVIPSYKNSDEFLLFLPKKIYVAVGRTIELYHSQISWCGNINNYHFKWNGVGRSMKRKWSLTGREDNIGSHKITCTVFDNNMNQVAQVSTTVNVVESNISTATKVLAVGDSLSNAKPWLRETNSLSNGLITYTGTRWNGDVQGGDFNHEGRSGATAWWYLEDSSYTFESNGVTPKNPFWNPATKKFDLNYYKETYNIEFNAIQLFLGTNGINLDPNKNVNSIKSIIDGIRATDAHVPIYVVNTLFRGDQNGMGNQLSSDGYSAASGVWKLEEDRKVFNLMVALSETLEEYSNVHFIPVSVTHDSEYNFRDTVEIQVNPRSSITELVDIEATHPSAKNDGYYQMADIMFSTFCGTI